jgi:VWFA-related protein
MLRNSVNIIAVGILCLLHMTACSGGGGGGGGDVSSTPNIVLSQSTIDFSGVVLDNSADSVIQVKNTGNANLTIGDITQPNLPFNVSNDSCSNKTLAPSQTCSVNVHFSPTSQDLFTGTFSIPSNDPDTGALNISLKGSGYGLNAWISQVNTDACPSPEISIDVNVNDPKGVINLNTLALDAFTLFENGIPINPQTITLTNLQPSPVSVVLTLDRSTTTNNVSQVLSAAAKSFIDQLNVSDEVAICNFNNLIDFYPLSSPYFIPGDDSGKIDLKAHIDLFSVAQGTRFYDAVFQSIDRAAQGNKGKRAVIVLSDGVASTGTNPAIVTTIDEVIANAQQKGIPVFTIFYVDPNMAGGSFGNPQLMQRLAQETGGQYYNSGTADLTAIFQQISIVLSNKYTLKYKSASSCAGTINLDVSVESNGLIGKDSKNISFP